MKKISLCILGLSLCINLLFAQDFVRDGYIVKASGDTVRGLIHDKEWTVSPAVVTFQESKNGSAQEFSTSEIQAFYSSRPALYERHSIKYDGDRWVTGKSYPSTREPSVWIEATLFLETLVKSNGQSLYVLGDANGRQHFFLRSKLDTPVELLSRQYLGTVDGVSHPMTSEQWKQQLINASTPCENLKPKILAAKYNGAFLRRLVDSYNECVGAKHVTIENKSTDVERKKPVIGIMAQPFMSYTEVAGAISAFGKINFGGGFTIEIFSKKRPNRHSIYNELKYKNLDQKGDHLYSTAEVHFKIQSVRLVNAFRFSYPKGKSSMFWNIGLTNGFRISSNVLGSYEKGFETGAILGAGTRVDLSPKLKGSLELRYEVEEEPFKRTAFFGSHNLGVVLGIQL